MAQNNHILFGVLGWGLGHATRSIPVINALIKKGFTLTIASDGLALQLLRKEFPDAAFLALQSPKFSYSKNGSQAFAVAKHAFSLRKWYLTEQNTIKEFINKNNVQAVFSDNRPSVFSPGMPSFYITHQVYVKAGFLSYLVSFGHQWLFKNFTEIWVPDVAGNINLSGDLGHKKTSKKIKYIGFLSDLKPEKTSLEFDAALLLSGPEPQRTLLENALVNQLKNTALKIALLRGTTKPPEIQIPEPWKTIDLASRADVANAFERSKTIVARNGYSTLMDLYSFPKPALLIPTPGQPEQEYLATLPLHKSTFEIQTQQKLDVIAGLARVQKAFEHFKPPDHGPNWDVILGDLFLLDYKD